MEIGKICALILIIRSSLDGYGRCSATPGDKVGDAVPREAFVVVYVSCANNDPRAQLRSQVLQIISQRDFIRARVVADVDSGLHIGYGWVMEADKNKPNPFRKILQLSAEPSLLIASRQQ